MSFAQDSWMTKGVDAYRHARHAEAIQYFEHGVIDDPQFAIARLSLGLAYLAAYIPGAESRENRSMGRNAEENLRTALEIDPQSTIAILYLAQFYYTVRQLELPPPPRKMQGSTRPSSSFKKLPGSIQKTKKRSTRRASSHGRNPATKLRKRLSNSLARCRLIRDTRMPWATSR